MDQIHQSGGQRCSSQPNRHAKTVRGTRMGQGFRERFIEESMSDTHQVSVGMKLKLRVQRADESAINYFHDVIE